MRENFEAFDEYDLERSIEQPQRILAPEEDQSANRYGFSFLVNVPLYKHIGNNVLMDVNKRDEDGIVIKNTMYFPRLMLIPFKNIQAPIPGEIPASRTSSGSYEANMRPFNPDLAGAAELEGMRRISKSALKCAELFKNTYGKEGGVVFDSLTGIETYARAKAALMAVLPLGDAEIFPRYARNVLGEEFISPFLDEILDYLQSTSARVRINQMSREEGDAPRLMHLYNEVLAGARNANTIAKGQIATTEQQIAATPQMKSGYDIRDTQFASAPDPFDLVCLAHRNERPKSERALEQARKMQENNNEPLKEVADSMNKVAEMMLENQKNPPTGSIVGMTAQEISELVKSQVAAGIADFQKANNAINRVAAPEPEGKPIVVTGKAPAKSAAPKAA